jgi:hypothetical protein
MIPSHILVKRIVELLFLIVLAFIALLVWLRL